MATYSAVKEKGNKENNNLLFHCNGTVIALGSAKPIIHTCNLLKQHECCNNIPNSAYYTILLYKLGEQQGHYTSESPT